MHSAILLGTIVFAVTFLYIFDVAIIYSFKKF